MRNKIKLLIGLSIIVSFLFSNVQYAIAKEKRYDPIPDNFTGSKSASEVNPNDERTILLTQAIMELEKELNIDHSNDFSE